MEDQEGGLELLSPQERQAVVDVVKALVEHDEQTLRLIGAISDDGEDPYEFTRDWHLWPQVDLVLPPGDPSGWEAYVMGTPGDWWGVDLIMWTAQEEGPSSLMLHLAVAGPRLLYKGLYVD